jgi:16S rRNA (guanine(527)-N(7))-methyltransferase RsmG
VGIHGQELRRVGVPDGRVDALDAYLALLERWNRRVDLTAARDARARVEILVRDAVRARDIVEGPSLLDVGSGNGSPGLVLALLRPELRVTLLEPRLKRWAFLREACRTLGRPDVSVERQRYQDYGGSARTVTLRALQAGLESLGHLVAPGGLLLVFGTGREPTPGLRAEPLPSGFRGQAFRHCST